MIRTGTGLIALISAIVALGGPTHAATMLAEQAAAALALLDEVAVLALILAACILIDKTSWPFLTGQKSDHPNPAAGTGGTPSERPDRPDA